MITGHLGVAAAARSGWPRVSLFWLLPAAIAPDLLDVAYSLAGLCSPYGLYSHTIPAVVLTGAVLGGIAFLATGSRTTGLIVAGVVLAHLPLDFVTGRKIFWPGGPLLGLRLYERPLLDFLVEVPLALGGWWSMRRTGAGPRWAALGSAAVALVAVQATFDALEQGVKPSGCHWPAAATP